jgi:hypothetical protein
MLLASPVLTVALSGHGAAKHKKSGICVQQIPPRLPVLAQEFLSIGRPTLSSVPKGSDSRTDQRDRRFDAQQTLWAESSLNSVRHCGRSLSKHTGPSAADGGAFMGEGRTVAVKMSDGVAGFAGLQSCGSPWACPVCSGKISPVRATEIQKAVDEWHKRGNKVVFATFTMRHDAGQKLQDLWDGLSHAWGRVTSGSSWERDSDMYGEQPVERVKVRQLNKVKYEVRTPGRRINFIRAVEVTHGENGWHVHIHVYLFCHREMTTKTAEKLGYTMFGRWRRALVNKGFKAPSLRRGVDVKLVDPGNGQELGKYFAKNVYAGPDKKKRAGWELAGGTGKDGRRGNRSPFEILADIVALGDADDLARWFVYEQSSKGRRQITWSHGFRELLGVGMEKTDEEIAADDKQGDVVMTFDLDEWKIVRWHKGRVLKLVELGCTKEHVWAILRKLLENRPQAA